MFNSALPTWDEDKNPSSWLFHALTGYRFGTTGAEVDEEAPPRETARESEPVAPGVLVPDLVGYRCCCVDDFLVPSPEAAPDLPAGGGVKLEGDEAADEGLDDD